MLYAVVVMPDHVHMLIEPQPERYDDEGRPAFWELGKITHSLKSYTANEINRRLERTGPVWQKESYDRLIRSETDLQEKFVYVISNPDTGHPPSVPPDPDWK